MVSDPEDSACENRGSENSASENSAWEGADAWPEVLTRACASTRGLLAGVTQAQLAQPTPCTEWAVRDLVNHIVGALQFFADLAELGESPADEEWPDYAGGDFLATFDRHAARATTAFAAPGAMDKVMALPTGPTPGSLTIQVATGEIFVHGWDLATAVGGTGSGTGEGTGDRGALDDAVAGALLLSDWLVLCVQVRGADPAVFAPEIEPPDGASAADRLAAFLGRDLAWKPLSGGRDRPARLSRFDRLGDQLPDGTDERLVEFLAGWLCSRGHVFHLRDPPVDVKRRR